MRLSRLKRILICVDQFLNVVIFDGDSDETVSARAYREQQTPKWAWRMAMLDRMFFWEVNHCEESFKWELARRDMPPAYRG